MSSIRNVALIAHVDHGKTTLVDSMLKQSGVFHVKEVIEDRVMDSNPLEKERGITILAKNTSVMYEDIKINIIDTPGHADFGGEVERSLSMVDGVLLIVDAFEGPMPQTRFVLQKALSADLVPIVVINKIDRPDARVDEVIDEVLDLFIELDADESQLEFPVVYASARQGIAKTSMETENDNLKPLFETIVNKIPEAKATPGDFQMLITSLDNDSFLGRYAIGKINRGEITSRTPIVRVNSQGDAIKEKFTKLFTYQGLKKTEVSSASAGDIIAIAGLNEVNIGETITDAGNPESLPIITVDEPTISMTFQVNNSPFAGQDGKNITSRKIRERLYKELDTNVSLRVEDTDSPDIWKVSGRGELHLSILVENMRREGYELQVSKPEVIYKTSPEGKRLEPIEKLHINIPDEFVGGVIENLGYRKAEMINMTSLGNGNTSLEFKIPARGLIGFRSDMLTTTRGTGIVNHTFLEYAPYKGEIVSRHQGSLIAWETGETTTYGLLSAEERGILFVEPGVKIYEGMIVGINKKEQDMEVNVCKKKHLTNMRSSSSEDTVKLKEPQILTLEEAIEFITDDELVEVTPQYIRLRKKYLTRNERAKASKNKN